MQYTRPYVARSSALPVEEAGPLQFSLRSLLYLTTAVSLLMAAWHYMGGSGLVVGLPLLTTIYWARRRRSIVALLLLCLVARWGYGILGQSLAKAHFARIGVTLATDDDAPLVISHVERLERANPRILDEDLAWLAFVPATEAVWLDGSRVSDAALVHLQSLPRLRWLDLSGTRVTDSGMAEVGRLGSLKQLVLSDTAVTDNGLRALAGLRELRCLRLERTSVTDAGLVSLFQLTNLESIHLTGTHVTDEGIRRLRGALPRVRIYR